MAQTMTKTDIRSGELSEALGSVADEVEFISGRRVSNKELAEWFATEYRPTGGGDLSAGPEVNVFDVFQQVAFTDLVRRAVQIAWEQIPAMGDQVAPMVPTYDRTVKREIAEVASFGVAQFRAPDGTPAIYAPEWRLTEEVVSLLLIDEMQRITEEEHLKLTSPTPAIRARAGVDLITAAKILQLRNENLTEAMRWSAFKGNPFVVTYPNTGQQATVQWNYTAGHKPFSAVPWTDRSNSTPIDDLRAWQYQMAQDIGIYGSRFHMNTNTWTYLQRSNQARGYLTPTDRNVFLPGVDDIAKLLYGSVQSNSQGGRIAESPMFIVTDAGYRAQQAAGSVAGYNRGASAMTKYLLDGEVLVTLPYMFEGEPIADTLDGMVAIRRNWNELSWMQGAQSEIVLDHYTYYFRQASARFVRLRRPEAFLLARCF